LDKFLTWTSVADLARKSRGVWEATVRLRFFDYLIGSLRMTLASTFAAAVTRFFGMGEV
jgi:hypothetical protein